MHSVRVLSSIICLTMGLGAATEPAQAVQQLQQPVAAQSTMPLLPATYTAAPMIPELCDEWLHANSSLLSAIFGLYHVSPGSLPKLNKVVTDLATRMGMPKPALFVMPGWLWLRAVCAITPVPEFWRAAVFSLAVTPGFSMLVIGDTVIEELEPAEIEALVAAELVHIREYHDLKKFTFGVISHVIVNTIPAPGVFLQINLGGIIDFQLRYSILSLFCTVMTLVIWHKMQHQADRIAGEYVKPTVLADALQKKPSLIFRDKLINKLWPVPCALARVHELRSMQRSISGNLAAAGVQSAPAVVPVPVVVT